MDIQNRKYMWIVNSCQLHTYRRGIFEWILDYNHQALPERFQIIMLLFMPPSPPVMICFWYYILLDFITSHHCNTIITAKLWRRSPFPVISHVRQVKVQLILPNCAICFFMFSFLLKWKTKRFCGCTGWSEAELGMHVICVGTGVSNIKHTGSNMSRHNIRRRFSVYGVG